MPRRSIVVRTAVTVPAAERLADAVRALEAELEVPSSFPPDVLAEAERAAANPRLPALDRTDVPFVTIDPPGSRDLDQALHIESVGSGYRVWYAIADVAAFVDPGGALDAEVQRRGQTLYAPDHRVPLHPPALSEGAASLLPDQTSPALIWTIDVDSSGEATDVDVRRALVRSRQQLSYDEAQQLIDKDAAPEVFSLLRRVGELRQERERDRGGVSLPLPEQEVVVDGAGDWALAYRRVLPVEDWNAQISLLTGMSAADLMLRGGAGILRTLPPAADGAVARLRRTARALGVPWTKGTSYPDFVRTLDPNSTRDAAMLNACTSLLRGAAYVEFDGDPPDHAGHAALANEYAHVTAPLRRLVDRYTGEIAVALSAGAAVPEWVLARLPELPTVMQGSDALAKRYERAVLDVVEATLLAGRVGETFPAAIVDLDDKDPRKGSAVINEPAVEAPVSSDAGPLPLGEDVTVRLVAADAARREVRFEQA